MSLHEEGVKIVSEDSSGWNTYVINKGTGKEIKYVKRATFSATGGSINEITLECYGDVDVSALPENVTVFIERSKWDVRRWVGGKYKETRA